ncbi:MAG: hypothetical protein ACKO9H_11900, partial [Planctomycetota bacterium]
TTTGLSQPLLAQAGKSLFSLAAISKLNWLSPVLRPRILKPICSNQQRLILQLMFKCQLPRRCSMLFGMSPPPAAGGVR